jgi:maltose O-acetyltransferase
MWNSLRTALREYRDRRRWRHLRKQGMRIGRGVNLPRSTWIDPSHAHLISNGDHCVFGADCALLAHDALANEFVDATRVAPIVIHESCHIGMRTIVLPGVEIGPRCIVGAGSVVSRSLPPDCVAAGQPARPICTLQEYLGRLRERMAAAPGVDVRAYQAGAAGPDPAELLGRLTLQGAYIRGGWSQRAGRRRTD